MLFSKRLSLCIELVLILFSLSGCGEKTVAGTKVSKLEESQRCIDCHNSARIVTDMSVTDGWRLSSHNTKNGAGCADCHEPHPSHPNAGNCNRCHGGAPVAGPDVTQNPDASGKCAKCHSVNGGYGYSTFNDVTRDTRTSHFNNTSSSYVSSQNVGKCRNCHNPHDTDSVIDTFHTWARSGHGRTGDAPWNYYDFKSRTGDCNRCHTTTGFIKFLTTGDSNPWGSSTDKTKEMLECRACHSDYSYKLRPANQVTAKYASGTVTVTYPDIGMSNLCLNCHAGRESGATIKSVQRNYTGASFVNSHYMAAGGIMFGKIGYEYEGRDYSDLNGPTEFYRHRYIGTSDPRGNSSAGSSKGPCVGCHLANKTEPGGKHTLMPFVVNGTALSPTCYTSGCHGPTITNPILKDRTLLEVIWGPRYQAALSALKYFLATNQYRKLYYYPGSPYFFKDTNGDGAITANEANSSNSQRKWHSIGGPEADPAKSGMNNLGAAFNYNLLIRDKGGVAHNRFYTRRLIYDAIDWIDDNEMNYSVGTALSSLSGDGVTAFKAESFEYIINSGTNNVNLGTSAERY